MVEKVKTMDKFESVWKLGKDRVEKSFIIEVRNGEFHVVFVPFDFDEGVFEQNQHN